MIQLLVVLIVVGVVLYLVNNYVPMAAPVKTILNVVVVVGLIIWLLRVTGIVDIPMSFGRM